jgi:uncharacterized protein YjiS (DUF1127 family)
MFTRTPAATTTTTTTPARTGFLRRFFAALALHRQRRGLLALDAHMLRDIGMTPEQACAEAALPFWPAPRSWFSRPRGYQQPADFPQN